MQARAICMLAIKSTKYIYLNLVYNCNADYKRLHLAVFLDVVVMVVFVSVGWCQMYMHANQFANYQCQVVPMHQRCILTKRDAVVSTYSEQHRDFS